MATSVWYIKLTLDGCCIDTRRAAPPSAFAPDAGLVCPLDATKNFLVAHLARSSRKIRILFPHKVLPTQVRLFPLCRELGPPPLKTGFLCKQITFEEVSCILSLQNVPVSVPWQIPYTYESLLYPYNTILHIVGWAEHRLWTQSALRSWLQDNWTRGWEDCTALPWRHRREEL